tara:strand:- start:350 stop:670 length:321 start_codon:yes stop_codon:yes gene_type:complete
MDYIKELPFELQNKILYMAMIHPTSKIIKDLKKSSDEMNNNRINLDTGKKEPQNFYESLCSIGILQGFYYRLPISDDFLDYIVQKVINDLDLTEFEEEIFHFFIYD